MSITKDAFYDGKVHVFQPSTGFRAGTDSVLLAASLGANGQGRALEIGCGAGGALLPAAWRCRDMQFHGIDRDPDMVALAERGIAANHFGERVSVAHEDAGALPTAFENAFDLVFSNPPFFGEGTITSPGEGKSAAYLESLPLKDWIEAMLFALRPKGTLVMIHRAAELARILAQIERSTGEITVMPVRSFPGSDAKRVIVRARKGLRSGPMRLLAGIDLYDSKGGPVTARQNGVARDGEGFDWS